MGRSKERPKAYGPPRTTTTTPNAPPGYLLPRGWGSGGAGGGSEGGGGRRRGQFAKLPKMKRFGGVVFFDLDYRFTMRVFDFVWCHINTTGILQGEEGVFQDSGGRGAGAGGFVQRPGSRGARKEVRRKTRQSASEFR